MRRHATRLAQQFVVEWGRSRVSFAYPPGDLIPRRRTDALVDSPFSVNQFEEFFVRAHRLGAAQKQIAKGTQREVAQQQDPILGCRFDIDQQIPAGNQIEARKRGVSEQVMLPEGNVLARLWDAR